MGVFYNIENVCDNIAGWFDTIEDSLGGIPLIGSAIAAPFGYVSSAFDTMSGHFHSADDWVNSIAESVSDAIPDLSSIYEEIRVLGVWAGQALTTANIARDAVGKIEVWKRNVESAFNFIVDLSTNFSTRILDALGDTWGWVVNLNKDFPGYVINALGATWEWVVNLSTNFSENVLSVLGATWSEVQNLIGDFVGRVGDAVAFVEITFSYGAQLITQTIPGAITDVYYNTRDLFDNFVDYVYAAILNFGIEERESIMAMMFDTLDKSWGVFNDSMMWLVGKVIDLVADSAEYFSEKIWNMIEKIIEKI